MHLQYYFNSCGLIATSLRGSDRSHWLINAMISAFHCHTTRLSLCETDRLNLTLYLWADQQMHLVAVQVQRIVCILENPLYFLLPSIMQEASSIGKNLEANKLYPHKHSFPYSSSSTMTSQTSFNQEMFIWGYWCQVLCSPHPPGRTSSSRICLGHFSPFPGCYIGLDPAASYWYR